MSAERPAPLAERPLAWWTVALGVVAGALAGFVFELASPYRSRPAQAVESAVQLAAYAACLAFSLVLADRIAGTSRRLWAWPVAATAGAAVASLVHVDPAVPARVIHFVHLRFRPHEVLSGTLLGACLGLALSIAARSGAGRLWKLPAAGSVAVAVAIPVLLTASHAWRWLGPSDALQLLALYVAMGGLPGLAVALGLRPRCREPEPDA
jgi:hypothetical protein